MQVPFINLAAQHSAISKELDESIAQVIRESQFIKGEQVKNFESQFAVKLGKSHCISVNSGTDALFAILKSLPLRETDEVITPAFSWISSAETITLAGGKVVFADIEEKHFTIDVASVKRKLTPRTKAVIAVHLYGQAADVDNLQVLCRDHGLVFIEDCAQAHFTMYQDEYVGTFGNYGAFSFYPTKNLGAIGDGGCIVTKDSEAATRIRRLVNHGALMKDDHLFEGFNSRMDTLQAAILCVKMKYINEWNSRRRHLARLYSASLSAVNEIILPVERDKTRHTYHLYVIRARQRDQLQEHLGVNGIQTIVHYPQALPNLPAYAHLRHQPADFPVATSLASEGLSLPIHPELTDEQVQYVCSTIKSFYGH
jgi:dTDP-4-amino-4,6-dideoxygalactose transaminase